MTRISTRAHGVADYAAGALLVAAPALLRTGRHRSGLVLRAAGGGILGLSAATDYELGLRRRVPMPVHLRVDAATGATLLALPWLLRTARRGARHWLPHVLVGASELAAAAMTERTPSDREDASATTGAPAPSDPLPGATPGVTGEGIADDSPRGELGPRLATPPVETPGPSVTPPELPESDTERAERADSMRPDPEVLGVTDPNDALVAEEAAAAAAEARSIGGPAPATNAEDPAMDPVYQAGGGEQEGWEQAEADLIENATHGEGHGDPLRDALGPEAEADRSSAIYGEADEVDSTELLDDPSTGPDDPGTGPKLGTERGSEGVQPRPEEE
jgi:hypothetical protein